MCMLPSMILLGLHFRTRKSIWRLLHSIETLHPVTTSRILIIAASVAFNILYGHPPKYRSVFHLIHISHYTYVTQMQLAHHGMRCMWINSSSAHYTFIQRDRHKLWLATLLFHCYAENRSGKGSVAAHQTNELSCTVLFFLIAVSKT